MLRRLAGRVYLGLVHPVVRQLSGLLTTRQKARTLIRYGRRHGTSTLVETGTYQGETVAACLQHFKRIYTVELDQALHGAARDRFADEPTDRDPRRQLHRADAPRVGGGGTRALLAR